MPAFDPQDVEIGARLQEAIGPMPVSEAAAIAGCSSNSFRRWLRGESSADAKGLGRIAAETKVSLRWLIEGRGPKPGEASAPNAHLESDRFRVPVFDIAASAGPGRTPLDEAPTAFVEFPLEMLRSLGDPASLRIIRIDGDSMEPELRDRDYAMLDASRTRAREGVHCIRLDQDLYVKRLRLVAPGKVELVSTNSAYAPIEVDLDHQDLELKGLVVWAGIRRN